MHVLIIGCGYVGMRAASAWLRQGATVAALTRSPTRGTQWQGLGIVPVIGDVLDVESLKSLPAADLCLYAVAWDRRSGQDQQTVSVDGLRHVLEATRDRVSRLIYVSSTSVYGQDAGEWVDEDSVCEPVRDNGRICLEAEHVVRECFASRPPECSAVVLRSAGIYGPGRLIGRLDQLRAEAPLSVNPKAWLNLIHVEDLVQAILTIGQRTLPSSTYIVSDSCPVRRQEFYETLADLAGTPPPRFADGGDRSLNKRCHSGRIRSELGLEWTYPRFDEGLRDSLPIG